jgi:LCP family protein required for cell wall assembly
VTQPAPVRRKPRRKGLRLAAGVVSLAVLGTSTVGYAAFTHYTGEIKHVSAFAGLDDSQRPAEGDSVNILVVGSDNRTGLTRKQTAALHVGSGDYGPPRTDTIMVMHVNKDTGGATVVSLPRDSYVEIPAWTDGKGVHHDARKDKINSAFESGGAPLTVATVEKATGLRIDHYVEVNFAGFLNMVDALDGVPICLSKDVKDKDSGFNLPAGKHVVSGKDALAYVRMRHVDSDFGRMARQQKFIASMLQKATSAGVLLNPMKLNSFIDAGVASVTTDEGLGRSEIVDLASRLRGVDQGSITFLTVPISNDDYRVQIGKYNQSTVKWDEQGAKDLFTKLASDQPIIKVPSGATVKVAPSAVKVKVYNGAGVSGLGKRTATELSAAGFVVVGSPGNSGSGATATVISYDPSKKAEATTLAAALPGAKLKPVDGLGSTLKVVVGSSYSGVTPVKSAGSKPTTTVSSPTKVRTAAQDICS